VRKAGQRIPIICGRPNREGHQSCTCTTHQSRCAVRCPRAIVAAARFAEAMSPSWRMPNPSQRTNMQPSSSRKRLTDELI
jgi:hypothetical protein